MTRDEVVTLIKQRMGNNTDSTLDALIVTEMQHQQEILERDPDPPYFLFAVKEQESLSNGFVVFDQDTIVGEIDSLPMFWSDATSLVYNKDQFMIKDDWPPLAGWNDGATTNLYATRYSHFPDASEEFKYQLYPQPQNADYKYYLPCVVKDTTLSDDIENKFLKHVPDLMIAKTGAVIAGQYEALEKFAAAFVAQQSIAENRLMKLNTLKSEENIRRLMGDS